MGENRFQIRNGPGKPQAKDLLEFEFGYDRENKKLYIGIPEEEPLLLNPDQAVAPEVTLESLGIEKEIALLSGADSNIQEQLNGKQPSFEVLSVEKGGTSATTAAGAVQNLGILDIVYPIGSIYVSTNSTSPAALFGGTWTQIKDRFLLGAGDSYTNGSTGGKATHTLTINEMPNHDHTVRTTRTESYPAYWHSTHTGSTDSSKGWAYLSTAGSANSGVGSLYVEKVGGGAAHDNMPPYLAVYIWQRTA